MGMEVFSRRKKAIFPGAHEIGAAIFSQQGSTPTPWSRGLRDQIQKWAVETQKTLYF